MALTQPRTLEPALPMRCPTCGSTIDPYHPMDARVGLHRVKDVTPMGALQRQFVITNCWKLRKEPRS